LTVDLTPALTEAIRRGPWSVEGARDLAATLARRTGATVEWDEDAGERWARVLTGRHVLALVRTDLRLVLHRTDWAGRPPPDLTSEVVLTPIENFDECIFEADRQVLRSAFPSLVSAPESLDAERFSISDLWWATV
jgi:hypothetical protein